MPASAVSNSSSNSNSSSSTGCSPPSQEGVLDGQNSADKPKIPRSKSEGSSSIQYITGGATIPEHARQAFRDALETQLLFSPSGGREREELEGVIKASDATFGGWRRGCKTVCEEAKCPNIGECWEGGTATLMLLGDTCTRGCRFCAIKTSAKPPPPDPLEPKKVADAVAQWDIDYIVLTSVDRDDMPDGGAAHFAETVRHIKEKKPDMLVECLVSDFQGMRSSVSLLVNSGLDVYAHNVETVPRLAPFVRDRRASFSQSLSVLRMAKEEKPGLFTKTSIMLGLGETEAEVGEALKAIRDAGVDAVTLGQYLRPSKQQLGVVAFISPQQFEVYRQLALDLGFRYVASGPLTRSSYRAGEFYLSSLLRGSVAKLQADVGGIKGQYTTVQQPDAK
ncbi:lipoic acid related protein [Cyclospora cayetanensis]|uniref:Lipoyl synthase, apicoplast n=1 Tax=Cyclospora cayetanensis TaxID=88456 RepID=A0A1D3D8V5_9EIME|nr:lipoic acid related protein [Cyclospora cayetanensis]